MAQRSPRSPEPRGIHAFAGALGTDRLNPGGVPDPLNVTDLYVDDVYSRTGSEVTYHNNIEFSTGIFNIGSATVGLNSIYVDNLRTTGIGDMTLHTNLVPNASETIGTSSTNFANGFFTEITTPAIDSPSSIFMLKDVLPSGTVDIGSSVLRFAEGHFTDMHVSTLDDTGGGTVTVSTNLSPDIGSSKNLGTSSAGDRWNEFYINTVDVYMGITMQSGSDILPSSTSTASNGTIGDATHIFRDAYIDTVNTDNIDSTSGAGSISVGVRLGVAGDVDPSGGGTYDLGDSTNYWELIYGNNLYVSQILSRGGTDINVDDDLDMATNATVDFSGDSNTASAGVQTLPSNPVGFITVKVNGTSRKVPYYAT